MNVDPTKTVNELVNAISYITDIEDERKIYHSWRVACIGAVISEGQRTPKKLKEIFYAALLHDIGGVGFPYHIIHYLMRNDRTSKSILLSHPIIGAQLVSSIPQMSEAAKLILDHHEWINGEGYPRAKAGTTIPFGSQVIRIADAADIFIQTDRVRNFTQLAKKLSETSGEEYPRKLLEEALRRLARGSLIKDLLKPERVPQVFEELQKTVGPIHVSPMIDAVGSTLEVVSQIIDMKHPYSSGHSLRVSRYAMAIALAMNLGHDDITRIKWAGLIHDIGKLHVSRKILTKRAKLTSSEYKKVKAHATFTKDILDIIPSLKDIVAFASSHHEHYDGTGYPLGLHGKDIPLGARILVICDAFDAMTSNRPYRNPLTPEAACREIKRMSSKQFDPDIAKIALPIFKNLGL